MRNFYYLLIVLFLQNVQLSAQNDFNYELINTYPSSITVSRKVVKTDITYRMGNGATTFLIDFEGNLWDEDSKGAIKYACQLLEEYLPTSYPIKIKMIRDSSIPVPFANTFVHLSPKDGGEYINNFSTDLGRGRSGFRIPTATMKRFGIFYGRATSDFYVSSALFNMYDGEITFSPSNIFSHTIDGNVPSDKYDLVTTALREIARVLGIYPGVTRTGSTALKTLVDDCVTPYSSNLFPNYDPVAAYHRAISGQISLYASGNTYNIYSPSVFNANKSLLYFVEDVNNEETLLLQPELPKGTSILKIGRGLLDILRCSGWSLPAPPVGGGDGGAGSGRQVADTAVRSVGVISIPGMSRARSIGDNDTTKVLKAYSTPTTVNPPNNFAYQGFANDGIVYDARHDNNPGGWSFYLIKKDGTLDKVFSQQAAYNPFTFDLNQISNFDDYTRTSDGYLRGRINWNYGLLEDDSDYNYAMHMYIDYKPPTPVLAPKRNFTNTQPDNPNSFYREVELAFSNVVGATSGRVIQKEYDSGRVYTSSYSVNVTQGTYIATVDKEIVTTFQLVTQNENGTSYSDIITIQPIANSYSYNFNLAKMGNTLECKFTDDNDLPVNVGIRSGKIYNPLDATSAIMEFMDETVDISSLSSGIYIVNIVDEYNNNYSKKIVK